MSNASTSWARLPPELRDEVLSIVSGLHGTKYSQLATISWEWHSFFETLIFAEISLTPSRLFDTNSTAILFRKRSLIRYIWFRVELESYHCYKCPLEVDENGNDEDVDVFGEDPADNNLIVYAFQSLAAALSTWEPRSHLVLDISVSSPSDALHCFKYLSFCPDTHLGECSSLLQRSGDDQQGITTIHDPPHGWVAGRQTAAPHERSIYNSFDEIMSQASFLDEEREIRWWRSMPLMPAVTAVLLRQQTRRQWWPATLANMLTRFPNMTKLCYEPWREWSQSQQLNDQLTQQFIDSFHKTKLSKLTIFENFNEAYTVSFPSCPAIRVPSPVVSHKLASASVQLTELSASFKVNASCFFWASKRYSLEWRNLTRLALTARALTGDEDFEDISSMLRNAAGAALKMPKLETMELWNGRQGVAMLFRYQKARDGQSAVITVRGTLELALGSAVTEAWEAVALRHRHGRVVVQSSLIKPNVIRSHGDAIRQLGLSVEVIRPVSLRQIIEEHQIREGLTTI
ncbi:hypothetical protein CGCF415_v000541 [Colletotrichum fructicola]|uniref:DUF6546 domain-containing protein n=1 Tax=Colletotrichum fructicola (strain Nara gc5) TaxID=1213859 RepID=L2FEE5_COLFN|nr:uncharacterized protein CGMCC3_g7618 [Colletotrichum fructicola]KAF4487085.1 hypothetical protein CGGC5_v005470 [Colletotrichum fructicola Nara gc5]KAE9576630.1 hypothetical protein CGMCC3_g7618 [Colletotrichum fructicola]KAF4424045.1 hypothetical protein CFRS1_v006690 [Colletotrichum fructicola]KAF4886605.1 hypothetical protein CGCFRS4_v011095 [Colletotrichum fructicola]KAF4916649.1 hypothetical protein CGCF415_v000541 [Colletotrichum fructicola]